MEFLISWLFIKLLHLYLLFLFTHLLMFVFFMAIFIQSFYYYLGNFHYLNNLLVLLKLFSFIRLSVKLSINTFNQEFQVGLAMLCILFFSWVWLYQQQLFYFDWDCSNKLYHHVNWYPKYNLFYHLLQRNITRFNQF